MSHHINTKLMKKSKAYALVKYLMHRLCTAVQRYGGLAESKLSEIGLYELMIIFWQCKDYGVPQSRERVLFVESMRCVSVDTIAPTETWTIRDAITT